MFSLTCTLVCVSDMVSILSILGVVDIQQHGFQAAIIEYPSLAAAFGPPVLAIRVALSFETTNTPGLDVRPNLLRICIRCSNEDVHVIAATTYGVQFPIAKPACFGNLNLDNPAFVNTEYAGMFVHLCFGFELSRSVGQVPSVPEFYPAAFIPREPCPVRWPRQEKCDCVFHYYSLWNQVTEQLLVSCRENEATWKNVLADASGYDYGINANSFEFMMARQTRANPCCSASSRHD